MSEKPISPPAAAAILLGIVCAVGGVCTFSSERLAFSADGELVLLRTSWWGASREYLGTVDGGRGRWWIQQQSDGKTVDLNWRKQSLSE